MERRTDLLRHAAGAGGATFDFVGNVEGRDFFDDIADVIVTDGFTGNVALKTMEGTLRFLIGEFTEILGRPEVAEAADALYPHLLRLRRRHIVPRLKGAIAEGADAVGPKAVRAVWRMGDGMRLTILSNLGGDAVSFPTPDVVPIWDQDGMQCWIEAP